MKNILRLDILKSIHIWIYGYRREMNLIGGVTEIKGFGMNFPLQKIDNLDLTIGGNYFQDEGYREGEITDRFRWNLNSKYYSKIYTGLTYGLNANFYQSTGSNSMEWYRSVIFL